MGLLDSAFNGLKGILGGGPAADHLDQLHEAVNDLENDPSKLGDLIGKLSNHPEVGEQVQSWLGTPQAQAIVSRLKTLDGDSTPAGQSANGSSQNSGSQDDDDNAEDDAP